MSFALAPKQAHATIKARLDLFNIRCRYLFLLTVAPQYQRGRGAMLLCIDSSPSGKLCEATKSRVRKACPSPHKATFFVGARSSTAIQTTYSARLQIRDHILNASG